MEKGSDSLEYQVLSAIRESTHWNKYSRVLEEDLFESYQTKTIFRTIADFHSTRIGQDITTVGLKALIYSSVKQTEKDKYRVAINKLRKGHLKDSGIIEKIVGRFIKRQKLKQTALEALDALEQEELGDLERIRQRIDEAIGVDVRNIDDSYNYFKDPIKRVRDEANEPRIATLISKELDNSFLGGLAAGEIAMFIAPTNVGKTLALVNVAYGALVQKKKVIYVTLELSPRKVAKRLDMRIAQSTFSDLKNNPGQVQQQLKTLLDQGAGLHIKDYSAKSCSVLDLRSYLDRTRSSGFPFDIVIVDYADEMYTPKQYSERRYELSHITSGLRRLANEFKVPLWTASQANREAGRRGVTELWDIAEDIGKANKSDLAITISQTEEEREDEKAVLRIAKNRIDRNKNDKIVVYIDLDTMTMEGTKPHKPYDLQRELRG